MKNLTELAEWQALVAHQKDMAHHHMRDLFMNDNGRFSRYSLQVNELFLDYSRNRMNDETIALLLKLAQAIDLPKKINELLTGDIVNISEKRPALHTALRDKQHTPIRVNGENISPLITAALEKMRAIVDKIHHQEWKGITGRPFTDIVNIGIGGSYLGPLMCTQALRDSATSNLRFHFISTIDQTLLNDVWREIDPETTLFIISSKSFSTLETFTNAQKIVTWMIERCGSDVLAQQFIAITAATDKARAFGIPDQHILPLWDWVGGRYSIWSAIGLPLMLMIGDKQFNAFLDGAYEMDQHFKTAELAKNMPVLLALMGIWYINFFGASAQAIAPYTYRLRDLISYFQQADMESNGKSIRIDGKPLDYLTGPVIFGEEGCNGQHSYHQLLHQGRHLIPVDFILIGNTHYSDAKQDMLLASGLSQAQALMHGRLDQHMPHRTIPGNRPSNTIFLDALTPKNLGALIALYEHKIFVQGAIWQINSFDQWGVELGKQILPDILHCIQESKEHEDQATAGMISRLKQIKS